MQRFFCFFLIAMLALVAWGCQSSSSAAQNHGARLNIGEDPYSLDPRKASNLNDLSLIHLLFDGLARKGREGKTELALAERVDVSSDAMTYTFHLKKTAWSNGDLVTAGDFESTWKQLLSPQFPSGLAFLFYDIKNAKLAKEGKMTPKEIGVLALDSETLQVTLEHPTPYFLELVAQPSFYPVNQQIDKKNPAWAQQAATYVNNGPFSLAEWKRADQILLKKNPTYWDAAVVKLDFVHCDMLAEETELKLFEQQELDWIGAPLSRLPLESLKGFEEEGRLKTQPTLASVFLRLNVQHPLLANTALRRALSLAIDRQAIAEHVTRGGQQVATGLVPLVFGLQKAPYFPDADRLQAKALFEQALSELHLSKAAFPELTYIHKATERGRLIAQAIQQQWFDVLGIHVKLEASEGKVFFSRIAKDDYQIAYSDWVADFADPINFLDIFKSKKGGSNHTNWENPYYAALLDQAALIPAGVQRSALLAQAEKLLIDEMPLIPLLYLNMLYVSQPRLKDVVLSSEGRIDFKWAFIEESR